MGETRGDPDLAQEPFGTNLGRQFGPKYLECNTPIVTLVLGEKHDCHTAFAKLALDRILAA
jgi:hypothetical protein